MGGKQRAGLLNCNGMHLTSTLKLLVVIGICGLFVAACAPKKPVMIPQPATENQLEMIRSSYDKVDPGARVGRVIAVLPADQLVAVGELTPNEFHLGDTFTLIDSKQNILTRGKVVAITKDALHIKYQPLPAGQRDPIIGDLAVHVSPTAMYHPAP
jgi:hypothetical protein